MEETRNIVSSRASSVEGMSISVGESRKKVGASSLMNSGECSVSPVESEKKNQRSEICSVYSGQKPTVYINPMVQTETTELGSVPLEVEVDQSKLIESHVSVENTQSVSVTVSSDVPEVTQQRVLDTSEKKITKVVDRRRRTQGTIVWEPLLVPSEMDGKIEMVTALKRVDSDYISAPRINPKKRDIQFVKQTPFKSSSKVLQSSPSPIKQAKSQITENSEKNPRAAALSKHRAGSNIKVQMDKAIAEKEASILKEIETAMREAAKFKSKSSSVQPSTSVENKVSNAFSEKRKVTTAVTVATPGSVLKKKKSRTTSFNTSNDELELSVDFPASSESVLESSTLPQDDKETHIISKDNDTNGRCPVLKTTDLLPSTSTTSNATKDSGSSGKIITTLGTVVASSITNNSELQGIPKILTLPSKVPPPLAPLSKDVNPVNRIVTSSAVNSSSSSSLQRILVLTAPTGVKNVGTPDGITLMPITSMPITPMSMTPIVTTSNLALPTSSVKQFCGENGIMNKPMGATEKIENPQDVHLIVTNLPLMGGESVGIGGSSSQLHGKGISIQPTVVDTKKTNSQTQMSHMESSSNRLVRTTPSIMKGKQKTQKSMSRELASLVIDCNNVQPSSSSVLRARTNRTSPKSTERVEDKSRNAKVKTPKENWSSRADEFKNSNEQKTSAKSKNNFLLSSEQEYSSDKKRQKSSPSFKSGKKNAVNLNSVDSLKERLKGIEQLYDELPPAQPHISITTENFDNLKNSIQNNLHGLGIIAASIKNYISGCKLDSSIQPKKDAMNIVDIKSEMEMEKVLCRLCGGLFKIDCVVGLFSDMGKEKNLISMFNTILPQSPSIRELDGLPQQICLTCADKLTLCFNIINQFLQADKELRHVLHEKNDSMRREGGGVTDSQVLFTTGNQNCSEESEGSKILPVIGNDVSGEKSNKIEKLSPDNGKRKRGVSQEKENSSDLKKSKMKGIHSELEKRPVAVYPAPNHKHKRKRSKSPDGSKITSPSDSVLPIASTGCIDLSRLDPEFNVGFEVEWCLDEETIRSSLVPEEDMKQELNHEPTSANDDLKRDIESLKTVSSSQVEPSDKVVSSNLVSEQKKDIQKKDEHLVDEKPKSVDEVSKLSEMHPSIYNPPLNSDGDQCPVMGSQDKSESHHYGLFQSQETFKCSYCPLSFPNKQEAFLHKVMKHEEELESVMKPQDTKLYSSNMQKNRESPKKLGTDVSVSKVESKSRKTQEPTMCDQCGLAFPNEYSLYIHKCVIHENFVDGLTTKDPKGVEYKILHKKEVVDESQVQRTAEEIDGKILVKCGTGMLWVSSSKLVSEEQKTTSQASDGSAVANGP